MNTTGLCVATACLMERSTTKAMVSRIGQRVVSDGERIEGRAHGAAHQRLADIELAHGAALGNHDDRRDLIGHDQRGECIGDDAEAARLHHHDAAHPAHPGARQKAERLVLASGANGNEIIVGSGALDQRRQHIVRDIGDQPDVIVLQRGEKVFGPGHVGGGSVGRQV